MVLASQRRTRTLALSFGASTGIEPALHRSSQSVRPTTPRCSSYYYGQEKPLYTTIYNYSLCHLSDGVAHLLFFVGSNPNLMPLISVTASLLTYRLHFFILPTCQCTICRYRLLWRGGESNPKNFSNNRLTSK